MSFRPTGSDHAITSSSFTVTLASALPRDFLTNLPGKKNPWADALPATREMRSVEVQIQTNTNTQLKHSPAVEFAFLRPNGTPTWVLRIDETDIFVECTLYTRWKPVWKQASELLAQAMAAAAGLDIAAKSLTMQVVDRFETDTTDEAASTVFSANADIAKRLVGVTSFWHQHVGWLETASEGEVLQNINVDVVPKNLQDRTMGKAVNILHLQRLTFANAWLLSHDQEKTQASLSEVAAGMHARNKAVLRDMLSADLQNAIQLDPKKQ